MATSAVAEGQQSLNGIISDPQSKNLTDLPTELLEHILCFPVLKNVDICNVSCCCKRLHDVCHERGKVWGHQYKLRCCYFSVLYRRSYCFWWLFTTVYRNEAVFSLLSVLFRALNCSLYLTMVSFTANSQAAVIH